MYIHKNHEWVNPSCFDVPVDGIDSPWQELTMRSACVSPAAQAAWSLLAAYGAAPPKLRQEQLPKVVPQTCQVRIFWDFLDVWRISKDFKARFCGIGRKERE